MRILIYHRNWFVRSELEEFLCELKCQAHFAETIESAVTILNNYYVEAAFLEIRGVVDIGILQYINQYCQNVRAILVMENEFINVISAIKNGSYGILRQPFGLTEIQRHLPGLTSDQE